MADTYLTLAEAANYRTTPLEVAVIENILEESPVLSGGINVMGGASPAALPFQLVPDRLLTINRESTYPTVAWYDAGEKVTGDTGTVAQTTFTIKGMKTRIVVPREVKEGYGSLVDQMNVQLQMNLKAMTKEFMNAFYYGKTATNSKEPNGLHSLVSSSSPDMLIEEGSSSAGTGLNLTNMDLLTSMGRGTPPFDMIVCSRQLYRTFTAARRSTTTGIAGNFSAQPMREFGVPILFYNNVPIFPDDNILDTETVSTTTYDAPTGGATTTLFAIKFGPRYLSGVSFSQIGPVTKYVMGPTQDYDGDILWVLWDVGILMRSEYSVAAITGILPGTAIAA